MTYEFLDRGAIHSGERFSLWEPRNEHLVSAVEATVYFTQLNYLDVMFEFEFAFLLT